MNLDDFRRVKQRAEQDTKMPDKIDNIIEKNNNLPGEIQYWQSVYSKQNYILVEMNTELNVLEGRLFEEIKFGTNPNNRLCKYSWSSTSEIKNQFFQIDQYTELYKKIKEQEYYVNYIKGTLDNIKAMSFTIKNYLDYYKIING